MKSWKQFLAENGLVWKGFSQAACLLGCINLTRQVKNIKPFRRTIFLHNCFISNSDSVHNWDIYTYHKHFLNQFSRAQQHSLLFLIALAYTDWGPSCPVTWVILNKSFQKNRAHLTDITNAIMKGEQARGIFFFSKQCWGWGRNIITARIRTNLSVFSGFLSTQSIPITARFYCLKCLWFQGSVLPKARLLLKYVLLYIHSSISPSPI